MCVASGFFAVLTLLLVPFDWAAPAQIKETVMDRAARRVLPVTIEPEEAARTDKLFDLLMGKGEASGRRAWMELKGNLVEADL